MHGEPIKILLLIEDTSIKVKLVTLLDRAFENLLLRTSASHSLNKALTEISCDVVITGRRDNEMKGKRPWVTRPLIIQLLRPTEPPAAWADEHIGYTKEELAKIPRVIQAHMLNATPVFIQKRRYRAFFDAALDGIFIETLDGDILDCNVTAAKMFGYTEAELCRLNVKDLVTDDIAARLPEIRAQHIKNAGISVQAQGKRKNGQVFPTEVSTHLVSIDGRNHVVAYIRDITSRKQTQTALLENERLYRTLFKQAKDAIFIEDENDQILDANPQACTLMGYSRDELIKMTVSDLQAPDNRQRGGETVTTELREHGSKPFETVNLHRDGTRIPVEVTNSVLEFRGQRLVLSIVRDIRARKETERHQHILIRLSTDTNLLSQPLDSALQTVIEETTKVLNIKRASIWRRIDVPAALSRLALVDESRDNEGYQTQLFKHQIPRYFSTLEHQRAIAVSDVLRDRRTAELEAYWQEHRITSALDIPVRLRGRLVGVLCYEHRGEPRAWRDDEIAFASQVADLVTQIFMNADLRQHTHELEAIAAISQQIIGLDNLENVLHFIAERATHILGADASGVIALDPAQQYVIVTHGFSDNINQTLQASPPSEELKGLLDFIKSHHFAATQIPDVHTVRSDIVARGLKSIGAAALLIVPMSYAGEQDDNEEAVGYLGVISHKPRQFSPEDISFLTTLAQQSINALENAYILQTEQERRELAEALSEAAAIVNSNLEPEDVLDHILEQVARVVDGDTFNILLLEDKVAYTARRRGYHSVPASQESLPQAIPVSEYPILQRMIKERKPVRVSDTMDAPGWISNIDKEWRRSYIGAPICIGTKTVGFLNVNSTETNRFGPGAERRLKAFADHAATAIRNAQLFQKLREYASDLKEKVKERTAEVEAQYARLEAVLNSTTDGIIVTTSEGDILQENLIVQAWRREIFSAEDLERFEAAIPHLAANVADHPETVLEMSELDLQLRAAPITGQNVGNAEVVIAAHDVSHLKALERMKSQFISNVSHELRTPVTTIKLYTQLLRQSPPEKHASYLSALETEANRQARLVQEILQFSRIDAGQIELKREPTQLNELILTVLSGQQALADQRNIALHHQLDDDLPEILANPDKIKQVLVNLVVNALQYTPEAGKVTISTTVTHAEGREWVITRVADTGFGIPAAELPNIFKRFYRGHKPRNLQIPGTGLGLAIVQEIVRLHDGWVTVESEPEKGSTFTIWLPISAHEESDPATVDTA